MKETRKQIARRRLLDIGLSETLLDSEDIFEDDYYIIIGCNGVIFEDKKSGFKLSISCVWDDKISVEEI